MSRSLIFLIFLWELLSRTFSLGLVFPPPSQIATAFWQEPAFYLYHAKATFQEMIAGMTLASIVALPLALLMKVYPSFYRASQPIFVIIQCIPMFTLAPLLILIFGWSQLAVIVACALMVFLPLTLNLYQGLCQTPLPQKELFQLLGASPLQRFFRLELPYACPHILSGLRVSLAVAGIGAVGGEWAGAQEGLGMLIMELRRDSYFAGVFVAISLLAIMTFSLYSSLRLLEKWMPKGDPCA